MIILLLFTRQRFKDETYDGGKVFGSCLVFFSLSSARLLLAFPSAVGQKEPLLQKHVGNSEVLTLCTMFMI